VLEADELIVAIHVPVETPTTRWGYHKVCRKPGEFADASAAVYFDVSRKRARVVLGATDGPPILLNDFATEIASIGAQAVGREKVSAAISVALPDRDAIDRKLFTACVERALEQSGVFSNPKLAE
jgi:carbon-monoxide dehydrogenase medium subunit